MTASIKSKATADFDDCQEWLASTLSKFPDPGPNVARRLIDILEPDTSAAVDTDSLAA